MKAFAALYRKLDSATSTRAKQAAMVAFFAAAKADPVAMGERRLGGLFPERRQAAADRADPPSLAPCGRRLWLSRLALRRVLRRGRRSRRDAVAHSARRRARRGRFARHLDARAAAAASLARRGGALRQAQAMGRRPRDRRAARLLQADHRGIARRRVAAAGGEGAGRSRGRRRRAHGAKADRLCAGAADPDVRRISRR